MYTQVLTVDRPNFFLSTIVHNPLFRSNTFFMYHWVKTAGKFTDNYHIGDNSGYFTNQNRSHWPLDLTLFQDSFSSLSGFLAFCNHISRSEIKTRPWTPNIPYSHVLSAQMQRILWNINWREHDIAAHQYTTFLFEKYINSILCFFSELRDTGCVYVAVAIPASSFINLIV